MTALAKALIARATGTETEGIVTVALFSCIGLLVTLCIDTASITELSKFQRKAAAASPNSDGFHFPAANAHRDHGKV